MSRYDQLAERFGTPAYFFDLDVVTEGRDWLYAALPPGFDAFYALKANPHPDVARALREGDGRPCRAEISSVGELAVAISAGYDPGEILYTGPGKTHGELDIAIGRGVRMFSVESLTDMQHVGAAADRYGVTAKCLLRINSITGSATTSIRMMGRPSQFGIDQETLPALLPALKEVRGARVVGAHFFSQSNAKDEDSLIGEFAHVIELAAQLEQDPGLPLEFLDIGGGFSSPYAGPGQRAVYDKLPGELARLLDLHLPRWRDGSIHLAVESGRYLVGSSGTLLCGVVNIKYSRGNKFVILDAGINAVGGLSGIGRLLPAAVGLEGAGADVGSLVGPLCTPGDTLGREISIPELSVGDVVAIPNVGAYGVTASLLSFLGRPAPIEVALRGEEIVSVSRLDYQRAYQPVEVASA
jgi:diaminopimelate decarboxylase